MSIPLGTSDATTFAINDFIYVFLTSDIDGVGHSAHPMNYKSPAHIIMQNDSSATWHLTFDGSGHTFDVSTYSTCIMPVLPSENKMTIIATSTTAANGRQVGSSQTISFIYFFPGEPLPHPSGK